MSTLLIALPHPPESKVARGGDIRLTHNASALQTGLTELLVGREDAENPEGIFVQKVGRVTSSRSRASSNVGGERPSCKSSCNNMKMVHYLHEACPDSLRLEFRLFLTVPTLRRFLAVTLHSDHDDQIPTTAGAEWCSLLIEQGHRRPEACEGSDGRDVSQGCSRFCRRSPHRD